MDSIAQEYKMEWAVDYEEKIVSHAKKRGLEPKLNFVRASDDEKEEIISELNRINKSMGIVTKHLGILNELLETDVVFRIWIDDFILQIYYEPDADSFDFTISWPGRGELGKVVFSSIPSFSYLTYPTYFIET